MSNRVPYNTVTGRAFYNPATGRALYVDQHSISAFTGAITFEYGGPWWPLATMTCYTGPGSSTDFGFQYEYFFTPTKTRLNNLNKLESGSGYVAFGLAYSRTVIIIEYLKSKNQLFFSFNKERDSGMAIAGPPWFLSYFYSYRGYFGQSTPTDGIDGVYDTLVSQEASGYGGAQTTAQTFAFTISS